MSRKEKEELIKSWKEDEVASPAGDVDLEDSDLENVSGGAMAIAGTLHGGTTGCCGDTEGTGSCSNGTDGCCESE